MLVKYRLSDNFDLDIERTLRTRRVAWWLYLENIGANIINVKQSRGNGDVRGSGVNLRRGPEVDSLRPVCSVTTPNVDVE